MGLIRRKALVLLAVAAVALAGCQRPSAPRAGDWIDGDGAYPVQLPAGRIAWLFGDSLVRRSDGRDQLVHNSIVVEPRNGGAARTIHGGTAGSPTDLIPAAFPGTVIWPGAGFVEGNRLQVFAEEISTAWGGFASTGRRFLVSLALPDFRLSGVSEVYGGEISWGGAVLVRGGDVYVYGNRQLDVWTNTTYLARFPLGASRGLWQFWDGSRFQESPFAAAPLPGPDGNRQVAKLASVIPWAGGIAGFTIDPRGATIDVRVAPHPWGPFSAKRSVYTIPERDAYLPHAYWNGRLLQVAYSVLNSRPSFVRALITGPSR